MIAPRLAGRRVLVTRAVEDAGAWAERLTALGAEPVLLPCIRTELFDDAETRTALTGALRDATWLCVLSPRGAEAVALLAAPLAPSLRIAVVGNATAAAVRGSLGHRPHVVARGGTSRALAEELLRDQLGAPSASAPTASAPSASARVVVAAAQGGRADLEDILGRAGVAVTRVNVYRTIPASRAVTPIDLAAEQIGDVLLASPSAVQGLLNQTSSRNNVRIFTIGPTTSAAVVAAGLAVSGEAAHPDLDSLVEAMQ